MRRGVCFHLERVAQRFARRFAVQTFDPGDLRWLVPFSEVCPGGPPGSCLFGRTGVACGKCLPDHYLADDECRKCDGSSHALFVVACIMGVVLSGFLSRAPKFFGNVCGFGALGATFGGF